MPIAVYIGPHILKIEEIIKPYDVAIYNNLNEFVKSKNTIKIAFLETLSYPMEMIEFDQLVTMLLSECNKIFVVLSEMHPESIAMCHRFQNSKIEYITAGYINSNIETHKWFKWFSFTKSFYCHNESILSALNPYTTKPKMFDILLGNSKYHRDIIYNHIKDNNLLNQVTMTYFKDPVNIYSNDPTKWLMEDGVEFVDSNNFYGVATTIKYFDFEMLLAQVIPITVYNQTAYSIVTETFYEGNYNLYSEKIVKPILAERLFIVFSTPFYLHNLKKLGFKTFDGIIDESYDTETNVDRRATLIKAQINYLMSQPQHEIFDKIQPITKHNRRLMLDTDWDSTLVEVVSKNLQLCKDF